MIETLTPAQKQQLSRYRRKSRKKWNRIIRSTERMNLEKATSANDLRRASFAQIYNQLGLTAPRIIFFPSPDAAGKFIQSKLTHHRWLTRLFQKITNFVGLICGGSGCISALIFFPFVLLYWLLRHVKFLSGFLNIIAGTIGLLTLIMIATGFVFFLLSPLTYCLEQLELKWNRHQLRRKFGQRLTPHFTQPLIQQLQHQISQQISPAVWNDIAKEERFFRSENARQIWKNLDQPICGEWYDYYGRFVEKSPPSKFSYCFEFPIASAGQIGLYDFCVSILQCHHNPSQLRALHDLMCECSFILPFEKVCFLCDRPVRFSVDRKNRLHDFNEPALEFADGSYLHFHHGLRVR
jgi:hypothetical protein